jgi:membrane protease YdiL (CAAX protease family)
MIPTFSILGISICTVWVPSIQLAGKKVAPWILFFICALGSGLIFGMLKPIAIVELGALAICAYLAGSSSAAPLQRSIFSLLTVVEALALAMHMLPGFNNPILISNAKLSLHAAPYTQYLNFDKGAVGLILLAFLCPRTNTIADLATVLRRTFPVAVITMTVVILTAFLIGYVKPDFKVSSYTPIFLATNLLFTCVAEEAFFRGFLQDRFATLLSPLRLGGALAILCSGILFGLVHLGGGAPYFFLSTLVGLGSGVSYSLAKRIEAPIITHFAVNAVHFVCFTYPYLQ